MKIHRILTNQKGLSLFLVVLIFVTIGLIAFGAATLSIRLQKTGKETATIKRMHVIRDALKRYYRGHQDLPAAASVPVAALNLEQKYRLDAWGQELHYNMVTKVKEGTTDQITDIVGLDVDDINVAGVIISSGPDQTRQTTGPPYTTTDDDIVVPVNLSAVAKEIALSQMDVIRRKIWAFAIGASPGTSPSSTFFSDYGLSSAYQYDPWGNSYVLGTDGIYATDGSFLPVLTKADAEGNTPTPLALAGSDFDEINDNTIDFGGGGAYTGDVEGDVFISDETPTGEGKSLSFDGDGDYINLGQPSSLSFVDNFTVAAWAKPARGVIIIHTDDMQIASKGYDGNTTQWELKMISTNVMTFRTWYQNSNQGVESAPLEIDTWTHVAGVFNEGIWKIYLNGELNNTNDTSSVVSKLTETAKDVIIGGVQTADGSFIQEWDGLLYNVLLYDTALTDSQVSALCPVIP